MSLTWLTESTRLAGKCAPTGNTSIKNKAKIGNAGYGIFEPSQKSTGYGTGAAVFAPPD